MPTSTEAEENLRVIRSLMEKATIYRALSAPGALVGGLLSVATAGVGRWLSHPTVSVPSESWRFLIPWLFALFLTAAINFALLVRESKAGGQFWISPRMRAALRAMLPAFLAGGFCLALTSEVGWAMLASLWVMLYGVSLLAMGHFAPHSLRILGWGFFSAGAALLMLFGSVLDAGEGSRQMLLAHCIMGGTFGLFHLVYAACTWPRADRGDA
jgi:hypothetical protein